MSLPSPHCS